jgi:hypothetical protein
MAFSQANRFVDADASLVLIGSEGHMAHGMQS